ncbi:MAG: hypothetical protein AAB780_02300 [Patescibacteria group bacterium]
MCATVRFLEQGNNRPTREFDAPDDQMAIHHAEHPRFPLKVIDPLSGGAVDTVPVELIELTEPPRQVKKW